MQCLFQRDFKQGWKQQQQAEPLINASELNPDPVICSLQQDAPVLQTPGVLLNTSELIIVNVMTQYSHKESLYFKHKRIHVSFLKLL